MVINHKINMDLAHPQNTPKVSLMQDDRYSRHIIFSLMENGVAWYPPEDASAIVRYEKADGTAGGNYDTLPDGELAYRFEGNNIDIVLAPQVCAAPGEVKLAAALISGNVRLHTFAITIDVERNPGLSVQSENYYKVTGSVADSGWSPNMFLGTDEDGNVVEKQGTGGGLSVELDATLTQSGKAADAKAVGDALANISGDGLSTTEKSLLLTLFKNAAYTADMSAPIAQLETLWSGGDVPDVPDVPDTPTGGNISATGDEDVTVTGATATGDSDGNVTVIGATATDDGNGNITVS